MTELNFKLQKTLAVIFIKSSTDFNESYFCMQHTWKQGASLILKFATRFNVESQNAPISGFRRILIIISDLNKHFWRDFLI